MKDPSGDDPANGYEALAGEFIARRTPSPIGAAEVRDWARTLPPGAQVLELGSGFGIPITRTLLEEGIEVFAVDASPTLVAAFRERFPGVAVECAPAQQASFFGRTFDAALAWGLIFLLAANDQALVLERVARVIRAGGSLLFTSPPQPCSWIDVLTRRESVSLGAEEYVRLAAAAGLELEGEWEDGGRNHYYAFRKSVDDAA